MKLTKKAEHALERMTDATLAFLEQLPPAEQEKRIKRMAGYAATLRQSRRTVPHSPNFGV